MADLASGTVFAGCRIDGVLGRGGMGVIYRATELRLGREVALKLISPGLADEAAQARFEREARLAASIEHPNVVPVYGAGEEDETLFLVMRLVHGTDLGALLKSSGRLSPERAAAIIGQIASALDAAHAAGLVHRDVKPGNILVGADDHVYLTDFGITRIEDANTRITDSGGWIGTVDYMSPEHLRGEPTEPRSDVYALGCVLHAALTGRPPMRRTTVPATIQAHLNDRPPAPSGVPGVPDAFDAVIARALSKDPAGRYSSAGELAAAATLAAGAATSSGTDEPRESRVIGTAKEDAPTRIVEPATSIATSIAEPATSIVEPATSIAEPATSIVEPATAIADPATIIATPVRPKAAKVARSRRVTRRRVIAVAVVAGLGVAGAAATLRPTERVAGPLTEVEVRGAVNAFAAAYSREDSAALARVLTPDAQRVAPNSRQLGRPAVVAEYRRQFASMTVGRYRVYDITVRPGEAGRAVARYRVTRSGAAPLAGQITFVVRRRGGKPAIALLVTEPNAV